MLRLQNLYKAFGDNIAVKDLTLEIESGQVVGLLGPNGAGKTTTINIVGGLLEPDRGSVELEGLGPPHSRAARRGIGVVPQTMAIYESLSAVENLRFFGTLQGLQGRLLAERVAGALAFVGLADKSQDRVKTYSGGMKRRLNLAIALVHDPPFLLLDEPTGGVDPQSRNAIFANIEDLRQKGHTIIYTTHYMEEAQRLCDKVAIIDHGVLLDVDSVETLISRHGGKSVVVAEGQGGEIRIETDEPLWELSQLQQKGKIIDFRIHRPDLEAVFLNLTGRSLRD